jgi:hypothetical protein
MAIGRRPRLEARDTICVCQPLFAVAQRNRAEVLAVELQQIERLQHGLASVTVPRRCIASKMATPFGPHTTASPSSVNDLARNGVAVTAIRARTGKCQNDSAVLSSKRSVRALPAWVFGRPTSVWG